MKTKKIDKDIILFYDSVKHTQLLENKKDKKGALSYKNKYGLWSSNAGTIRKYANKGFVGLNEYVDREGIIWYMNVSVNSLNYGKIQKIMCSNDKGEEKELFEVLGIRGFEYKPKLKVIQ